MIYIEITYLLPLLLGLSFNEFLVKDSSEAL